VTILGQGAAGIIEVQDEGVALPFQPVIDFAGAGVTATDDPASGRTLVTVPAGGVTDAQYLVLAAHAGLSVERVFTPGTALSAVDGGAGLAYTLNHASVATGDLHTEYARLAGRAGGQTLYGGTAANESIIIGGTAHATHATSIISMLDHVQMASAKAIKDSGGTSRYLVATTTPHNTITGDTRIGVSTNTWTAIGTAVIAVGTLLRIHGTYAGGALIGIALMDAGTISHTVDYLTTIALKSQPTIGFGAGVADAGTIRGLHFVPTLSSGGTITAGLIDAVYASYIVSNQSGTFTALAFFRAAAPGILSGTPTLTDVYGLIVENIGNVRTTNAYGVYISNITNATGLNRLLQAQGLSNENLRVDAGDPTTPGALKGRSQILGQFNENGALAVRRVEWVDAGAIGGAGIPANAKVLVAI